MLLAVCVVILFCFLFTYYCEYLYQWNSFLPGVLQCFNISHHNVGHIGSVSVVHYDVCVNETMQETLMLKTLLMTR